MRSPGRRLTAGLAAAMILSVGLVAGAVAHAEPSIELTPELPAFDAEFTTVLAGAGRALGMPIILAHAGQLSPKDECHKHKAAGERHWHKAGTDERGGECIKRDGKTVYMLELEAPAAPAPRVKPPWEACTSEWYQTIEELEGFWQIGLDDDVKALMGCLRSAYPRE